MSVYRLLLPCRGSDTGGTCSCMLELARLADRQGSISAVENFDELARWSRAGRGCLWKTQALRSLGEDD